MWSTVIFVYLLFVEDLLYAIKSNLRFWIYALSLLCHRLLEEFENHIEELKQLDEKIQRRVEKLEHQCHREAKEFAHKVQDLQRSNQVSYMIECTQNVFEVFYVISQNVFTSVLFCINSGGLSAFPGA